MHGLASVAFWIFFKVCIKISRPRPAQSPSAGRPDSYQVPHSFGELRTCRTASSTADANSSGLIPWSATWRSTFLKIPSRPERDCALSAFVGLRPGLATSQYRTWSRRSCCPIHDSRSWRSPSERSATLLESFEPIIQLYDAGRQASNVDGTVADGTLTPEASRAATRDTPTAAMARCRRRRESSAKYTRQTPGAHIRRGERSPQHLNSRAVTNLASDAM